MPEKGRKRAAAKVGAGAATGIMRNLSLGLLIVLAFVATYFLGRRKRIMRLDSFAQCITAKKAKMYGAYWCPHCAEQKEMFGPSFQYVDYIECGVKGSHDESEDCKAAGVKHFPTWQFMDGERREGAISLAALGEKTSCGLP